jgi:hypothetical protein
MFRTLARAHSLAAAVALIVGVVPGLAAAAQGGIQPTPIRPLPGGAPAASGKFRVTINGFRVDAATRDHILDIDGVGDEVFVSANVIVLDSTQGLTTPTSTIESRVYGEQRFDLISREPVWRDRWRAGTGTQHGGLRSGNSAPSVQPWKRLVEPMPENLPLELWCGTLTEGRNAAVIVPSIWEWDGVSSTFGDWMGWADTAASTLAADEHFNKLVGTTGSMITNLATLGLGLVVSLEETGLIGGERDRPIGVRRSATRPKTFEFTPTHAFVVNYRTADFSTRENAAGAVGGVAPGIYRLQFIDDPFYQGRYSLYVQIERIDGKPCAHEYVPPAKPKK